jgi:hypothetical protein
MDLPLLLVVVRRRMGLPPQSLLVVEYLGVVECLGFWLPPQGGDRAAQFLDLTPETGVLQLQFVDQLVAYASILPAASKSAPFVC